MRAHVFAVLCAASLVQACDTSPGRTFRLPTAPDSPSAAPPPSPAPNPAPLPRPPAPDDYTALVLGEPFLGRVPSNPPLCRDGHGLCQYFRLEATADGTLIVQLSYDARQQPNQSVDLSVITLDGESWGDYFQNGIEVRTSATRGAVYYVTVWYAFPSTEFSLLATIHPA